MKVLFDFSRLGIPDHKQAFESIRDSVLNSGHILTNDLLKETEKLGKVLPQEVFSKLTKAISDADCVIIEGSMVSISLGYTLTESINLGKPVLFLSDVKIGNHKNKFLESIDSKLLHIEVYDDVDKIKSIIEKFLEECPDIKTRFNLVLSNKLNSFVTKKSRDSNISKTEYILKLIEEDSKK